MSYPRRVLPNKTYLVTRKCAQRTFLLRPSETTNGVLRYLLAVAATRYDIRLHAFCVMSNHLHIVLTDLYGNLPRFNQFLNALVARAVNASLGRWEDFWAPNSYSAVTLVSGSDVVDKVAYTLANPVAVGLVRTGRIWPGVWSAPDRIGAEPEEVKRPDHFFSKKHNSLPGNALLELSPPPGFTAEEFRALVNAALEERERVAARVFNGKFRGVAHVLKQSPFARPASLEPRRGLNPRVAAKDKWKRIEALAGHVEFVRSYRAALERWRAKEPGVVFPAGTYLMRVFYGAPCAEPA
jgi:REP element-mobilizing transposase RayT